MKAAATLLLLIAAPALAKPGLPPEAAVAAALDNHPSVVAARARIGEARADARILSVGPQEVVVQGTLQGRDVRGVAWCRNRICSSPARSACPARLRWIARPARPASARPTIAPMMPVTRPR
jgi:hypothetical protein